MRKNLSKLVIIVTFILILNFLIPFHLVLAYGPISVPTDPTIRASLRADKSSPQHKSTTITWTCYLARGVDIEVSQEEKSDYDSILASMARIYYANANPYYVDPSQYSYEWIVYKKGINGYQEISSYTTISDNQYQWKPSTLGDYQVKVRVKTRTRTITDDTEKFTIISDVTQPEVNANISYRNWSKEDVRVSLSFSDNYSGISTKQYNWSKSTSSPTSWYNYTGEITQKNNGAWYLHYKAVDGEGNEKKGCFGPYKIDKSYPTVTTSISSRGWSKTNAIVNLTYSDSGGSGVKTKQYQWSKGTSTPTSWNTYSGAVIQAGEGIWYLHYRVIDNAGNEKKGYFGPYKVEKTIPLVTTSLSSRNWSKAGVTVSLTYSDSGGSGVKTKQYQWSKGTSTPTSWTTYSGSVTQSGDGVWYLHYRVIDNAGNEKTGYFGSYKIEKTIPSVTTSLSSRNWSKAGVTVSLTYSDSGGSGVKTKQYQWSKGTSTPTSWNTYSGVVTQSGEGIWYLHYRVIDNAGNEKTGYFGSYKTEKTLPAVATSTESMDWSKTGVTISLTYSDSGGSGLKTKQYQWSKGTSTPTNWSTYNGAVNQSGEGVWYLHYRAVDNAGNERIGHFGAYIIDNMQPEVKIYNITNGEIEIQYLDVGSSQLKERQFALTNDLANPSTWTTASGSDSKIKINIENQGTWYLHYKAVDYAGNEKTGCFGPYYLIKKKLNKGEEFNLSLLVKDIEKLNNKRFILDIITSDIRVKDFCTYTSNEDRFQSGLSGNFMIDGTKIYIEQNLTGKTQFYIKDTNLENYKYTGEINNIKFESLSDNTTSIFFYIDNTEME